MPFLINEGSRTGVPIVYTFNFGASNVTWGSSKLVSMGAVTMQSEPLDGMFAVSEQQTSFSDTDGAIWGSLGHGTGCLGSSWSATVFIGGTSDYKNYGPGELALTGSNTGNSGTYVIHSGRIARVNRSKRITTILSQNRLAEVNNLEWRFPITAGLGYAYHPKVYGTNLFYPNNLVTDYESDNTSQIMFNFDETRTQFSAYCYYGSTTSYTVPDTARGTMGRLTNTYFLGEGFYQVTPRYLFKGSYLGTYLGTIQSLAEANYYGFPTLALADTNKAAYGTRYVITQTRLICGTAADFSNAASNFLYGQCKLTLGSTPADLWKEMLTGACVTPLFPPSCIDTNSFATAVSNCLYSYNEQVIDPKGGKVLPYLKNLLEPLKANWSLTPSNNFKLYIYGPKYGVGAATLGSSEIIESQVQIDTAHKFNRVVLNYNYNFNTGSFNSKYEQKSSDWGSQSDFLLNIESKWLQNPNEVTTAVSRIINRYSKGIPVLTVKLPLSRLSAETGDLYYVQDDDCYGTNTSKLFEVIGWSHEFSGDRSVSLDMWDAQGLYGYGYAKWQGSNSLTNVVDNNSTSGWGTNGTVTNINPAYGSNFAWF